MPIFGEVQQAEIRLFGSQLTELWLVEGQLFFYGLILPPWVAVPPHTPRFFFGCCMFKIPDAPAKKKTAKKRTNDDDYPPAKEQAVCVAKVSFNVPIPPADDKSCHEASVVTIVEEYCGFKSVKLNQRLISDRENPIWRFSSEWCAVCLHHGDEPTHHNQFVAVNTKKYPRTTLLKCLKTGKSFVVPLIPL